MLSFYHLIMYSGVFGSMGPYLFVNQVLRNQGWVVMRFWEHELSDISAVVNKIQQILNGKKHEHD